MNPRHCSVTYLSCTPSIADPQRHLMSTSSSSTKKLAGYNLAAPTESDAVAALERVFGAARGRTAWSDACGMAGVTQGTAHSGPLLARVIQALAAQGGAAATIARSIEIRARTYTQIAARQSAPSPGARS